MKKAIILLCISLLILSCGKKIENTEVVWSGDPSIVPEINNETNF